MTLRSLALTLGTVAAISLVPISTAPAHAGGFEDCGESSIGSSAPVASSHYGVQKVQAQGVACKTALKVAKGAQNAHDGKYSKSGFTCVGKARGDDRRSYACTSSSAKVKFIAVGLG